MKKHLLVILVALMVLTATQIKANENPVSILCTSNCLLYLKFNKSMYGAQIEIRNEQDSVIFSDTVATKKIMIDLIDEAAGKYWVKISFGDLTELFTYVISDSADDVEKSKSKSAK